MRWTGLTRWRPTTSMRPAPATTTRAPRCSSTRTPPSSRRGGPPQPHQGILHTNTLSQHSPIPSPCPHSHLSTVPAGAAGLSAQGPLQPHWPLRASQLMALLQLSAPGYGQRLGPLSKCPAPYSSPEWPGLHGEAGPRDGGSLQAECKGTRHGRPTCSSTRGR